MSQKPKIDFKFFVRWLMSDGFVRQSERALSSNSAVHIYTQLTIVALKYSKINAQEKDLGGKYGHMAGDNRVKGTHT